MRLVIEHGLVIEDAVHARAVQVGCPVVQVRGRVLGDQFGDRLAARRLPFGIGHAEHRARVARRRVHERAPIDERTDRSSCPAVGGIVAEGPVLLVDIDHEQPLLFVHIGLREDRRAHRLVRHLEAARHRLLRRAAQLVKVIKQVGLGGVGGRPCGDAPVVGAVAIHDTEDRVALIDLMQEVSVLVLLALASLIRILNVLGGPEHRRQLNRRLRS
mmetsp:Transcript_266/g.718  ORF Transcript_266/g.718 Transcript_266/m.718 type:complete len:215 (+) Transcript_266:807-1451(+)